MGPREHISQAFQNPTFRENFCDFHNTVRELESRVLAQDAAAMVDVKGDSDDSISIDINSSIINFPQLLEIIDDKVTQLEDRTGVKLELSFSAPINR